MSVDSDDDYVSIDQYPTSAMNNKDAGRTPRPFTKIMDIIKCGSHNLNRKLTKKVPPLGLSTFMSPTKKERVLTSGRKQRCLFNTMHVKTAVALLSIFYLFGLAVLDKHMYWQQMSESEALTTSLVSIFALMSIVMAQFGLNFEKYMLLVPLLIFQILLLGCVYIEHSKRLADQIFRVESNPVVLFHVLLIMMYEIIMSFIHTYALLIMIRCIIYFRNKKTSRSRMSFNNRCFMGAGGSTTKNSNGRIVNLKMDMTTDDDDASTTTVGNYSAKKLSTINGHLNDGLTTPKNAALLNLNGGGDDETPKSTIAKFVNSAPVRKSRTMLHERIFARTPNFVPFSDSKPLANIDLDVDVEHQRPPAFTTDDSNGEINDFMNNNRRSVHFTGATFHEISLSPNRNSLQIN